MFHSSHPFPRRRAATRALACLALGAAGALALPVASFADSPPAYVFHVLPPLTGGVARPSDIDDQGDVVGSSTDDQGHQHAVIWRDGVISRLAEPAGDSVASRINGRGDIVGTSRDGRALLWRANGTVRVLGAGSASDINDQRAIVGYTSAGVGGVLYKGVLQPLAFLAGTDQAYGDAITASGGVVGGCIEPHLTFGSHATTWAPDGTPAELPGAGGESAAEGANDLGQSVGIAWKTSNTSAYATRWDGQTAVFLPSFASGLAWAINAAGQAVGRISPVYTQIDNRASLWLADTTWVDLNQYLPADLAAQGWVLDEAVAINASGAIVGTMTNRYGGPGAAFLLDLPTATSRIAASPAADRAWLASPGVQADWRPERGHASWH